jgi:hypothetical protein
MDKHSSKKLKAVNRDESSKLQRLIKELANTPSQDSSTPASIRKLKCM